MWGRGITANVREGFNRMEGRDEAVDDGVFMEIGIVRFGWFTPLFEGFPIFYGWTGLDWVRRVGSTA